jgi:hypothetical protein
MLPLLEPVLSRTVEAEVVVLELAQRLAQVPLLWEAEQFWASIQRSALSPCLYQQYRSVEQQMRV